MLTPNRILRKAAMSCFPLFEAMGFHVTPATFGYPVLRTKDLTDELFASISDCVGLDWNLETQDHYLSEIFQQFAHEVRIENNPWISPVDGAILHSMIRHHKPKKIVEIGSGISTTIAAAACNMNLAEGSPCELVAIEPRPSKQLRAGFPGLTRLVEKKVEDVEPSLITDCDLLFIDSSHIIKTGGDVNRQVLEIVPRLNPGALIHWHDILLPGEYWKDWVKGNHYYWTEQYLVHAFLKFNTEFQILWGSRYMHLKRPDEIQKVFRVLTPRGTGLAVCGSGA